MEELGKQTVLNVIARKLVILQATFEYWERQEHAAAIALYRWAYGQWVKIKEYRDKQAGIIRPINRHDGWGVRCPKCNGTGSAS